ncbi:MAG: AAA family ATPase, partial [Nostocoides sp.]
MRLHQLTITAFGPFADTVDLDVDEAASAGVFLIHGPTGAGKTSLL